ncbi:GNAT family N-acetyltransferase [Paenibacillus profundus]|uniref:GNAT family N-acetyltransferase n=1 Tax=Paenibacillus profundus TaxID=1173085 RepID=A0ABS8YN97_9BACL|nr:GNAT family protein [Paenibacillus profundus]MCE5173027.1 GNAT family N-acetyltransferase [Paenibacillus profundus]
MSTKNLFQEFPLLQTERLRLRQVTERDAPSILELFSDQEVIRYVPLSRFTTTEHALQEIAWYTTIFQEHTGLRWGIEIKDTGKLIGTCGFLDYKPDHRRAELGYDLSRPYWGHGIMPEAAQAVIDFGFGVMELNKIAASIVPENTASGKVLSKLGFRQEGLLRQHEFEHGYFVDLAIYAILREEYEVHERERSSRHA